MVNFLVIKSCGSSYFFISSIHSHYFIAKALVLKVSTCHLFLTMKRLRGEGTTGDLIILVFFAGFDIGFEVRFFFTFHHLDFLHLRSSENCTKRLLITFRISLIRTHFLINLYFYFILFFVI